jgi:CO dehydrogenase/acetyl-CoA synthase beta subunit
VKITAASSSSRVSTLPHLYSKKYYESRVKEQVDQELADKNMDEGQRLTTVNKILTRIFENEAPEVKDEIRKMQEQERRAREEAKGIEKHLASGETLTAKQLLLYVEYWVICVQY